MEIAQLSPEQRTLLELRLRRKRAAAPASPAQPALRRRGGPGPWPVSVSQRRLWITWQMDPEGSAYNVCGALRLEGLLNPAALAAACNEVVRRHESLRTCFPLVGAEPVQVVEAARPRPLPVVDLGGLSRSDRWQEARRLAAAAARQPFDLIRGPVLRCALLRLEAADFVLVVSMHHIVCDNASNQILVQELMALYAAFAGARAPSWLAEPAVQYADYACWQRERLAGEHLASELRFWRGLLGGALPVLALPTDRRRGAAAGSPAGRQAIALSNGLTQALQELGRREGATLFMTLLAVLAALLARYTGQPVIPVASMSGQRPSPELERLIGCFVDLLIFPVDVAGDPTFRELLRRVRALALAVYEHGDLPAEKLAEGLRQSGGDPRAPLARVALSLQTGAPGGLAPPGLRLSEIEVKAPVAQTDLALFLRLEPAGLRGELVLDSDLYEAATGSRLVEHLTSLLQAVVEQPERRLSELAPQPGRALTLVAGTPAAAGGEEWLQLTRQQALLWAAQRLEPELVPNNMASVFTLHGPLDVSRFRRALQTVIDGNEALRTVIAEQDDSPRQRFLAELAAPMAEVDLAGCPDPAAEARRWIRHQHQIPFDFSRRLIESVLFHLADDRHLWYLNHHQIVGDAWSTTLIFRRLVESFEHSLREDAGAGEPRPQFRRYMEAERAFREGPRYGPAQRYWAERLSEPIAPMSFYDRRPPHPSRTAIRIPLRLGSERSHAIASLGAQPGAAGSADFSRVGVLLAALLVYLHYVSGNRRLAVGLPSHNRMSRAAQDILGCLIVVLPLRFELAPGESFLSLVRKAGAEILRALRHGQQAVENPARKKYYEVMLNFIPASVPSSLAGSPVEVEWLHAGHGSDCVLVLQAFDLLATGELTLAFDLDCEVFDDALRSRAVDDFLAILDRCLAAPQRAIDDPLLFPDSAEKGRLLVLEDAAAFDFDC